MRQIRTKSPRRCAYPRNYDRNMHKNVMRSNYCALCWVDRNSGQVPGNPAGFQPPPENNRVSNSESRFFSGKEFRPTKAPK